MKYTIYLSIFLTIFSGIAGCKTDESLMPQPENTALDEPMDDEQAAYFDSLPKITDQQADFSNIVLPSGMTVQAFLDAYLPEVAAEQRGGEPVDMERLLLKKTEDWGPQKTKEAIIVAMLCKATDLTDRKKHAYPEIGENTIVQPNGLAYVYGGKDYTKVKIGEKDDDGNPSECQEKLYGLDCSGFMALVTEHAGFGLYGRAKVQANKTTIKNALDKKFKGQVAKIDVKEFSKVQVGWGDLESGDIIGYLNGSGTVYHIGVVLKASDNTKYLYQCDGKPSNSCEINTSDTKGPMRHLLKDAPSWLKANYKVFRFTIDISGEWDLFGKCVDQSYDALNLKLNFSKVDQQSGTFSATGPGTDYDGTTHFVANMTGKYDEIHNKIMNARIEFVFDDHTRVDILPEISLAGNDETPYIGATCIAECGCDLLVRLKNNSE